MADDDLAAFYAEIATVEKEVENKVLCVHHLVQERFNLRLICSHIHTTMFIVRNSHHNC